MTEKNMVNLRRTIYLSIMNSIDFEECAHKLIRLGIIERNEKEITNMFIECW
jgi:pre-mRNA-splicing factor CWC22